MTGRNIDHRVKQHPVVGVLRDLVRRARVVATAARGLWQASGYDGEVWSKLEVFSGVGFYARPGANGKPEAIVLRVGGSGDHAVVVASRDRTIQIELEEDETAIFNSQAYIKLKKNGDVEVKATGNILWGDGSPLGAAQGVVNGEGIDPFTGATYQALGSASAKVFAKK